MSNSFLFLLAFVLSNAAIVRAQDLQAPHGLAYHIPDATAISPEAYAFFNPGDGRRPKTAASATVASAAASGYFPAEQSMPVVVRNAGDDGVAGILIGFLFVVVIALGVYLLFLTTSRKQSREGNGGQQIRV
ncbi:unnamed protein product [Cuscuta epithymum]|uniref:Uncharacterized protein n=1 Tax=Cuscuta epithymum TaxID=186058 RepID=A0AAV0EKP4_9ASTE|nr:unnamed protein product [Cuscuta epithymum]